ncbi:MAG TPA: histidine kinase [Casimicrobiaceae bacterium]|nr:histidine kinase [Casimicrobiaceae bacterium]
MNATDLGATPGARSTESGHRLQFALRIDWRVVGLAAVVALTDRGLWFDALVQGRWSQSLVYLAENELTALFVVGLAAALLAVRRPALPRPVALALAVFVGCLASHAITDPKYLGVLGPNFDSAWTFVWFNARRAMLMWGLLAAAWYFLRRAEERRAALRESELARHRLDAQLALARLRTLEAQVEPHFLFNTLAHVRHLYDADPPLARQMLDRFCDYLDAALPQMRKEAATLGSELALSIAYLDVQKIRMGERLRVEIAVNDDDRRRPFPTMMLASLVENAIKHGLNPLPDGGTIRVSAESTGDRLRVVVADSGRGLTAARGTGVGLANIRGRLAAVYGAAARMTLSPNAPHGIKAAIEIPLAAPGAASFTRGRF